MRGLDCTYQELSAARNATKREAELRFWIVVVSCSFLLVFFAPLSSIFPSVSEYMEMLLEGGFLVSTVGLLLFYTFGDRGKGKQTSSLSAGGPSSSSTSAPVPAISLSPSTTTTTTTTAQASATTYLPASAGSTSAKRRMMTPHYSPQNFRSYDSEYSWEEIRKGRADGANVGGAAGGAASSSSSSSASSSSLSRNSEWQMNFAQPYQASPKDKVRGVKILDDGRAIAYMPSLDYIGKESLQSRWSETLRRCLGMHLTTCLREFDRACKELWEHISSNEKTVLAKVLEPSIGAATAGIPMFGSGLAAQSAAAGANITQETKLGIRDVLSLKVETVQLEAGKNIDLFALLDRAKFEQQTDSVLVSRFKKYKEAIQILSLLGKGCPLETRTRNLVNICKELRAMCSSSPQLRLAGGAGGDSQRSKGRGDRGGRGGGNRSDEDLIMAVFFNYCDVDRSESAAGRQHFSHNFTRDYYFSSYEELLKARGAMQNVGIVQNYKGTFDVFVKTATTSDNLQGLLLLEVGDEILGGTAYDAILTFLIVFTEEMDRVVDGHQEHFDGHGDKGAIQLSMDIFNARTR